VLVKIEVSLLIWTNFL